MGILRTDGQAALNSLLKTARETLHHYRDATELVDAAIAEIFRDISRQRREFVLRLEDAVRATGSLPAVPDPDKEAGEMLIHHVAAMIKDDYAPDAFQQRIDGEQELLEQVVEAKNTEIGSSALLQDFEQHIVDTITLLKSAHELRSTQDD